MMSESVDVAKIIRQLMPVFRELLDDDEFASLRLRVVSSGGPRGSAPSHAPLHLTNRDE